jgi:hypothetical protein
MSQGFNIKFNGIVGFAFMVVIFVTLFFLAKGIFTVLSWVAPVLIAGALIINYKTVLNFIKYMWALLKRNPLGGILGIVLSVIGFPILSGVLFGKAILDRKVKKLSEAYRAREEGEFVEFEEIIKDDVELHLPPIEKSPRARNDNEYKDLF